jgi:hypothetical protein
LIASIGLGNRQRIAGLVASDVDGEVLPVAARNLPLLTTARVGSRVAGFFAADSS